MRKIPRKYYYALGLLIVIGAIFSVSRFINGTATTIPDSFLRSKRETAVIADQIVNLSNQSGGKLKEIETLENNGQYSEMVDALTAEINRVSEARAKGSELLTKLNDMTQSLSGIKPESSRTKALEAINYETSIINHLITYNNDLQDLMRLLAVKFLYGENSGNRMKELIAGVNNEVKSINDLNTQFNDAMSQLEKSR